MFLGTLTVQAGSVAGETTQFTIGPNGENTFTYSTPLDLDNNLDSTNPPGSEYVFASATQTTFDVKAVPEPSTMTLLATGLAALCVYRRARRKG